MHWFSIQSTVMTKDNENNRLAHPPADGNDALMTKENENNQLLHSPADGKEALPQPQPSPATKEINGPKGPDPTRYGDWERNGRCIDF